VLWKIIAPKRKQVAGGWRRFYNEELHNLYALPHIVRIMKFRRMRWAGHVTHMGEMRNGYSVLVGKPEGKRPFGKLRRSWE